MPLSYSSFEPLSPPPLSCIPILTTSGAMYQRVWSLIRVPPNHDFISSEGALRYFLADETKKSKKPQAAMKNENDATDRNGWV